MKFLKVKNYRGVRIVNLHYLKTIILFLDDKGNIIFFSIKEKI